ncbi:MAG: phasin family protein [Desulfobacteraceae bacterium]
MFDYMKKGLLTGVGLALKSREEIRDLARDMAEKNEMNQSEGQKFFDDLFAKYDDARLKLDKRVEEAVEKFLKRADIPSRSDIRKINERIDKLSKELEKQQ